MKFWSCRAAGNMPPVFQAEERVQSVITEWNGIFLVPLLPEILERHPAQRSLDPEWVLARGTAWTMRMEPIFSCQEMRVVVSDSVVDVLLSFLEKPKTNEEWVDERLSMKTDNENTT